MSKIKNYQKLNKNSIFSNCSYALSAGVYYNLEGFSNVTNKILDMGTYNPDKYILGNITKPNKKTFVNYDKNKAINKGNNTKININNIKHNKETYAYDSGIIVPTIEAEVKPITEILKETENNITNSKNIVINSNEFKELHKEEKVINNNDIKQVKGKSSVNLFSKVFENKKLNNINDENEYTYTSSISVDWYKYIDKIYFLHSRYNNKRTIDNLHNVGINMYDTIFYKTELTFDKCKYYKSAAFLEAIEDAYNKQLNSIIIIKDDVKFIDNQNIIESFLENSTKHNISILNPNDIATDCVILRKEAILFIHNLNIDKSLLNWHIMFVKQVLSKFTPYKAIVDVCLHLIDYVVPFVDSSDSEWQKIHDKYTVKESGEANTANRFRAWDNFLYMFRCIELNCKFIDNVYLIVMQESQVPSWINPKKVNIVYHKDFIPEKHLPCFSSTLIETYMTNIKDISEYFIYGNDDLFVINRTTRKDWFETGLPKIGMVRFYAKDDHFSQNSSRSWLLATQEFNNNSKQYRTTHSLNGMLKSTGLHLHLLYEKQMDKSASRFRSDKDFNQYLYVDYIYAVAGYKFLKPIETKYVSVIDNKSIEKVNNLSKSRILCLNDCIKDDSIFNETVKLINYMVFCSLNNKSKYEK